ncbi:glycosyltransferase family 2 protein [Chloroflexota bacterium]
MPLQTARPTDLPPPPDSRTGWPWSVKAEDFQDTMSDGSPWPCISIVTPSYNQGDFIEETIRSVLLQGYPNLEYVIMDGGSTDGTLETVREYEPWLAHWTSEPDRGQADAINKGFRLATGSLLGWMNSDDLFTPSSFRDLATAHIRHPDRLLAGPVVNFGDGLPDHIVRQCELTFRNCVEFWRPDIKYHMPGILFPRTLYEYVGELDIGLRYAFDKDLLCRLLRVSSVEYLPQPVARFRLHPQSKTVSEGGGFLPEVAEISKRYWSLVEGHTDRAFRSGASIKFADHGRRQFARRHYRWGLRAISISLGYHPLGVVRSIRGFIASRISRRWPGVRPSSPEKPS